MQHRSRLVLIGYGDPLGHVTTMHVPERSDTIGAIALTREMQQHDVLQIRIGMDPADGIQ